MRQFLTSAQKRPHLFVFSMIALNTLARPDAVLDLTPAQVNIEDRLINLNPKGRKQTKKRRPIVPITDALLPFLTREMDPKRPYVTWRGQPVHSVKKAFRETVEDAKLPSEITPYSLRHTMAKRLRKSSVPEWEVEGMLGHTTPSTSEEYAIFDPDYQSASRAAIDAYFAELALSYEVPQMVACHLRVGCKNTTVRLGTDNLAISEC